MSSAAVGRSESPRPAHDVFISYSRKDTDFVNVLARTLENYTAPKGLAVPKRRLDIFLDRHDFQAGDYEERLSHYLKDSAKLIIVCSPSSRASRYVNQEIRTFAACRGPQDVIPVLIAGIPNNEATGENDGEKAFPDALCELMKMPVAIDYRNFSIGRDRVSHGNFADPWFTLLAAVYDRSRADVELREQRRRAKKRRLIASMVAIAVLLLVLGQTVALPRYRAQAALSAISQALGTVTNKNGYISVVFQGNAKAPEMDAALAKLPALPHVDQLDLSSCEFTKAGLEHLKDIRGLKDLDLGDTRLTDDQFQQIQVLGNLTKLALNGTNIDAAALHRLDRFESLQNLNLQGLKPDSTAFANLAKCTGLKVLELDQCAVRDEDLTYLRALKNLEELHLTENPIAGAGLASLELPHLKLLDTDSTQLTDAGLQAIGHFRSVQTLYVGGTSITNRGLAFLAGMPELRLLGLYDNPGIGDAGIEALGDLPKIQELSLKNTTVGDGAMRQASHWRTLQVVSAPVTHVGDGGMAFLLNLPNLREVYLGGDSISDAGVEPLLKIPTLTKIYLPGAKLTDNVLPRFRVLKNLRELSVGGPGVTKAGYDGLKSSMPRTKVLLDEAPQ